MKNTSNAQNRTSILIVDSKRIFLTWSAFWIGVRGQLQSATLTLKAPLDYQVVQRETQDKGVIVIEGLLRNADSTNSTLDNR